MLTFSNERNGEDHPVLYVGEGHTNTTMKSTFTSVSEAKKVSENRYVWSVPQNWAQGRTAFGGLVVGSALRVMSEFVPEERALRSLYTSFVGPVKTDTETSITVEVLRSGKSLSHIEARVTQDSQVCTVILGSFGADHERSLHVAPTSAPEVAHYDGLGEMPFIEGVVPTFTKHIAYRWTVESFPYSGADEARVQGWCRLRDTDSVGYPELVALLDAWPPPILSKADSFIPASSATWMINFFYPIEKEALSSKDWWLFDAHSQASVGGYADTDGMLWDSQGRLVAHSKQLAIEFS